MSHITAKNARYVSLSRVPAVCWISVYKIQHWLDMVAMFISLSYFTIGTVLTEIQNNVQNFVVAVHCLIAAVNHYNHCSFFSFSFELEDGGLYLSLKCDHKFKG